MNILLLEADVEDNGALRVTLDRASRWERHGARVDLLFVSAFDNGAPAEIPANLSPVIASPKLRSARWMLPAVLRKAWPLARRADMIVAGREMASGLLVATVLAKLARRPFAVTIQSNVDRALAHHGTARHRRNVLLCLKAADRLVPVSSGLIPGLVDLGIEKDRIEVVENGIDSAEISALAAEPLRLELPDRPIVVGLGRLSHEKGFDLLIRAHATALANGAPPHQLVIAGQGPELERLQGLIAELGAGETVTLAGFLPNPYALLARAELFVLSSRWEGFALALAEALALKVPPIAADCPAGPAEVLGSGRFGDLVPVEDVPALAHAISAHLREPARLREAATAGASHVADRFGADHAAAKHLAILRSLAGISKL